ncbi:PorP/SprF family type IX secretion system membrane protein [Putridiphycobacter roseus]|nr:PorP/SprF family type IX secretion system membrane protein [Putridiphycobacter roseus]
MQSKKRNSVFILKPESFKKIQIITLLLLIFKTSLAQDPTFSQFHNNPIYLNPALAGADHGCPSIHINSRYQNFNTGIFNTNTVSIDSYNRKLRGGIAFNLVNEMVGYNTYINNAAYLTYSFHQKLSRNYTLLVGVQAGYNQNFFNWNELNFGDQIDPRVGFIYTTSDLPGGAVYQNLWGTIRYLNINSGIAIYSPLIYGGFSVKNLLKPRRSFLQDQIKLDRKYIAHLGLNFNLENYSNILENVVISPQFMYSKQGRFEEIIFGFNAKYKIISLGSFFRINNAVIFSIGLNFNKLKLTYSQDYQVYNYSGILNKIHEVSLHLFF